MYYLLLSEESEWSSINCQKVSTEVVYTILENLVYQNHRSNQYLKLKHFNYFIKLCSKQHATTYLCILTGGSKEVHFI